MAEAPDQRVARARRGCFFYAAVAFLMLMFLMIAGGLIGYRVFNRTIREYTSAGPIALPPVEISSPELQRVQDRVTGFRDAIQANKPAGTLELTAGELNALLVNSPELQQLKDEVRITTLEPGEAVAVVSLPLDQVGLPAFRGRYLNGTATLNVAFSDGTLRVVPSQVIVNGKPLPKAYMNVLRRQNLARPLNNDSRASVAMNRLRDVKVENGKLVIVPRPPE